MRPFSLQLFFVAVALSLPLGGPARAFDARKFYFWIAPAPERYSPRYSSLQEGYVIEVDGDTAENLRRYGHPLSDGQFVTSSVGVAGQITAGSVDYNRNYLVPGHPIWNWHFTTVEKVGYIPFCIDFCEDPQHNVTPSEIAQDPDQWNAKNGDRIYPNWFEVKGEIHPDKPDALANVSNRGVAGSGERTLITGFIVTGGEPRNLVVRALGPSLGAQGIQQAATNPKLEVYNSNGTIIASNKDWKADYRADTFAQQYSGLTPTNDKEVALLLTLLPGEYTVQGANEDGTEAVMVIEAYDVEDN